MKCGNTKGRSGVAWFLIGFFVGIIGVIASLVVSDLETRQRREKYLLNENRRLKERVRM